MLTSMTTSSPVCHMILSSFTRSSTRHVPRSMRRLPLQEIHATARLRLVQRQARAQTRNWTVQSACSTSAPCASYRRTKHKKCILPLLSLSKTVPSLETSSGFYSCQSSVTREKEQPSNLSVMLPHHISASWLSRIVEDYRTRCGRGRKFIT